VQVTDSFALKLEALIEASSLGEFDIARVTLSFQLTSDNLCC